MTGFLDAPPAIEAPVVITDDRGGVLAQYAQQAINYFAQEREVRIQGVCNSACTLAISLPTACVYPQARLGFHLPRYEWQNRTEALSPASVEARFMWQVYPVSIQMRLGGLTVDIRYLTGREVIEAGVRECEK